MRQMFLLLALVAIGLVVITIGTQMTKSRTQHERLAELQNAANRGSITWHAQVAKAKGQRRVVLTAPPVEYSTAVRSIEEVLPYYSAVIAQPISSKTLVTSTNDIYKDDEIRTWYRFKIIENLSLKPLPRCSTCASGIERVPPEMLALEEDEVLVERYGGTVNIDGVQVTIINSDIPSFSESEKYLLFLSTDSSGKFGLLQIGPIGIYIISSDETLKPVRWETHRFVQDVQAHYGNSLETFRSYLQRKARDQ